jgi:hypothetical protein
MYKVADILVMVVVIVAAACLGCRRRHRSRCQRRLLVSVSNRARLLTAELALVVTVGGILLEKKDVMGLLDFFD